MDVTVSVRAKLMKWILACKDICLCSLLKTHNYSFSRGIVKDERMRGGVPCIVMGKAAVSPLTLRMSEEELKPVPYKGWAV